MKKILIFLSISALLIGLFFSVSKFPLKEKEDFKNNTKIKEEMTYSENKKLLFTFISKKLLTDKGIYTNYLEKNPENTLATGHEMLSESSGIWLQILNQNKKYSEFKKFYLNMKKTFDQGEQFTYRYNPITNESYDVNATLDDLRIIHALLSYDADTKSDYYAKEASKRFELLKKNTQKNDILLDYYDVNFKEAAKTSSLAYYDFIVLKHYESTKTYKKQLSLVKKGFLGKNFPLFYANYNSIKKTYSIQDLNTSEALITLLHLSQIKELPTASSQWLEHQVLKGSLYNKYDVQGNVKDKNQSSANYALASMIFEQIGDEKMRTKALENALNFQVTDKNSEIYGGIGDSFTNETYSFNNLNVLLALGG